MEKTILKAKEVIKRHDNIFAIILIFLSIFGITLNVLIESSDELWNFQNIYKMYNGFQIYKDANVIVTPLFFIIGEVLFKVLGANFLTFRIYNIIIMMMLYFFTYLLLKKLGMCKKISIIATLILIIFKNYGILLCQANYNTMALMFYILGVFCYIKKYKYGPILQGIILFVIFSTKQNIGVFYAIGLVTCGILSKYDLKYRIKKIIIEILIFLMILVTLLLLFYINGNLYYFLDYTILGISEFANENIFINISNIILAIFFICINLIITIIFIKNEKLNINNEEKEQLIILNCFAVPMVLTMIPILNDAHFFIGIYLSLILFIYIIKIIIGEINFKINKKVIDAVLIVLSLFACIFSITSFYFWINSINNEEYSFKKENPFYGGIINDELIKKINNVVEYIENNSHNVIVLSNKAAFYMIPTRRSNGVMDLPLKGNLGKEGEKGLIEKIKKLENTYILIEKEEKDIIWQESEKVRKYIIKNKEKVGEIEEFYIYK